MPYNTEVASHRIMTSGEENRCPRCGYRIPAQRTGPLPDRLFWQQYLCAHRMCSLPRSDGVRRRACLAGLLPYTDYRYGGKEEHVRAVYARGASRPYSGCQQEERKCQKGSWPIVDDSFAHGGRTHGLFTLCPRGPAGCLQTGVRPDISPERTPQARRLHVAIAPTKG